MGKPTIRKDALRSRRAILDAAHRLFANGGDASFAEIAQAAGVGQATVYRHFENREDLFAALAEEGMARLEETAAAAPLTAETFETLLRLVVSEQVRDQTLIAAIRRGELQQARVRRLGDRTRALFREPLATAQESGLMRDDLAVDDVMAALAMLDGALAAVEDHRDRGDAATRALDLLLEGFRPR